MNDQDFKKLFKETKFEQPTELHISRWKKVVRRELDRTPGEWARLAAACLIGIVIGASAFKGGSQGSEENLVEDATIERVHINTD
jgi:hypothetical protein